MTVFVSTFDMSGARQAGWAVLLGGLIGLLLSILTADAQRQFTFDTWQKVSPREVSEQNVSVVVIDNASLNAVGSWPWSRYYMARLLENIALQGPTAIGMDIIFAEADARDPATFTSLYPELDPDSARAVNQLPSMDLVLAQVIGSSPIVLARLGVPSEGTDPARLLVDPKIAGTPPTNTISAPQVLTNIDVLDGNALAHGMLNGRPDLDGLVRRVPLNIIAGDEPLPGLAVELARIASGTPQLEWRGEDLLLGDIALPVDKKGSLPIKLGEFPAAQIYSAAAVLTGQVPQDAFAGKVVLVGLGADGTADIVSTPLKTETIGVLVQAQAVDAILEGGWLERPSWAFVTELAAGLGLFVLLMLVAVTLRNWLLVPTIFLALSLPTISWVLFDQANLLLDPIRPLLIGSGAAAAMWIARYAFSRRERARLAAELVEQRVAAAEQEGELKAARRIQLGMVPGPEKLSNLDKRVDIGAILEPAKSIGGDFFDALMIGPDQLLFVIGDVTGKGVPAALFMALSKALSKSNLSRMDDDFAGSVAALNRDLMYEADDEMGVTMLVGLLDCSNGRMSLINAGHENPFRVRADGSVETLTMVGGPPFCVVDFPYAVEEFALNPTETLVVITDGATEAENGSEELFGVDGVVAAMGIDGDVSAANRAANLADSVRAFEGDTDPSDDLTIFALRYLA